jgi:hypothetical protein
VPAAANYTTGGAANSTNDDLAHFGPVERAIVRFFRANPAGPDGHHVRLILDGTKKIAPDSLHGDKDGQLQLIAYVCFFACRLWMVRGGRLMFLIGPLSTPLLRKGYSSRRWTRSIMLCVDIRLRTYFVGFYDSSHDVYYAFARCSDSQNE